MQKQKGITLIALIITIIVMLILVAVTINVAINGELFKNAKEAVTQTQFEADKESLFSAVIGVLNDSAEVDFSKLDSNLPEGFTGNDGEYTSKAGNIFYVDQYGSIITPIEVTFNGKAVTLTPENVGQYLGKVVTNYKINYNTTENVTIDSEEYTVSTKYRLYYVDFAGKYGDVGDVYLKADCTGNNKALQTTEPSEGDVVKIENLNPGLYKDGVTPPNASNNNMKAVTWLTNTKNWEGLKSNLSDEIAENDINYIVGAPSLEMMMDSYNTHYGLTDITPNTSLLSADSARVKLFYKYPYNSSKYGYGVGPSNNSLAQNGYYLSTSYYTVKTDTIDCMYYPGNSQFYWLSSPSATNNSHLMIVNYGVGGFVSNDSEYYANCALCPLVSLKSEVKLSLE